MKLLAALCALSLTAHIASAQPTPLKLRKSSGPFAAYQVDHHVRSALEAHGYIVAVRAPYVLTPSITRLEIRPAQIACSISIHIAPVVDGTERWQGGDTAIATATAQVTGTRLVAADCLSAAAEDAVTRRVIPFLDRKLVAAR